eukprot:scaffold8966_cov152-Amphora_coffeaeformis.AAC.2
MQQASLSLRKTKNRYKCKVQQVVLLVLTFPLLCIQVWLYQRHRKAHQERTATQISNLAQTRAGKYSKSTLVRQVSDRLSPATNSSTRKQSSGHNTDNEQQQQQQQQRDQDIPQDHAEQPLPDWIRNYVAWHKSMREKYPGRKLFEDPEAPKLIVRTCLGLCGGLNDRLGQLPWDLYLANQTNRVLLMHWHRPVSLENFLVPNGIDWRVPPEIPGYFPPAGQRVVGRPDLKIIRDGITDMFEGYESDRPNFDFWSKDFPVALQRLKSGSFASKKVVRHRLLGHLHEEVLEQRLIASGETDMIHDTATFGNIFRLFFRLAPPLQAQLEEIYQNLHLQAGAYSAVHCRVRHPKAVVGLVKGQNENYPADKSGLPWEGETRQIAIDTANRALRCAQTLQPTDHDPIYFFSDSNDLVHYMSNEIYNATFLKQHANHFAASSTEQKALEISRTLKVLARPATHENAHIDRQKGREAPAYYGTFIDLFLAMNARCVTYGVGYYAVFATKISHTPCKLLYQEEAWGGNERKRLSVPLCHLEEKS